MYRVTKNKTTEFIGPLGKCWIWLRDQYGHVPAKELMDLGWKIEKARKS